MLPLELLRDPSVWRSDAMAVCHDATLVSLLTYLPIYFRVVHGANGPLEPPSAQRAWASSCLR